MFGFVFELGLAFAVLVSSAFPPRAKVSSQVSRSVSLYCISLGPFAVCTRPYSATRTPRAQGLSHPPAWVVPVQVQARVVVGMIVGMVVGMVVAVAAGSQAAAARPTRGSRRWRGCAWCRPPARR